MDLLVHLDLLVPPVNQGRMDSKVYKDHLDHQDQMEIKEALVVQGSLVLQVHLVIRAQQDQRALQVMLDCLEVLALMEHLDLVDLQDLPDNLAHKVGNFFATLLFASFTAATVIRNLVMSFYTDISLLTFCSSYLLV